MMNQRPFRFGVIAEQMSTRALWVELARKAESLGYSTLLLRDHLVPDFFGNQFAPLIALMAAANVTTTLHVGTMVIDNDFRHPAMLAKEAATLDVLSDGRFELGIGAGWLEREYDVTGQRYDRNGVRIDRLEESIDVMKRLWRGEEVTFSGKHYQLDGFASWPAPARPHGPRLLIGGGGKRVLTLAGREANIVGVLTSSVATGVVVDDPDGKSATAVAERVGWVRDGAGSRFNEIELSMIPTVEVTDRREKAMQELIERRGWRGMTPDLLDDMPSVLIGSTSQIADLLLKWRQRLGFSYVVVSDDMLEAFSPVVAALAGI